MMSIFASNVVVRVITNKRLITMLQDEGVIEEIAGLLIQVVCEPHDKLLSHDTELHDVSRIFFDPESIEGHEDDRVDFVKVSQREERSIQSSVPIVKVVLECSILHERQDKMTHVDTCDGKWISIDRMIRHRKHGM